MTQHSLNYSTPALMLDKLGVIAGFLLGLLLGVHLVENYLAPAGASLPVVIAVAAVVVLACMRTSAALVTKVAQRIERGQRA